MSDENFTVVDLLCARMETNPDEFGPSGKFWDIAQPLSVMAVHATLNSDSLWMLTDNERVKLLDAYRKMHRGLLQTRVFRKILITSTEEGKSGLIPTDEMIRNSAAAMAVNMRAKDDMQYEAWLKQQRQRMNP